MKSIKILGVLALAIALAGCQSTGPGSFGSATVGLGVAIGNALKPANIAASLRNVRQWTDAVACEVQTGSGAAQKIEAGVKAGTTVQTVTGLVYTGSSLACAALGGTPTAVVPAAAIAVQ